MQAELLVGYQIKSVQFGIKFNLRKTQLLAFGDDEENKHQ
nr:MAG TPA: hypothetical protein [Caudoviricetes sp.]DAJ43397.1 MAG TPA: hypothetical protein [Caudoviricetes sp.]